HQKRCPRPPQAASCPGVDELDIQLGVIEVADVEGPVAVARGAQTEFPIKGLVGISGAGAFALADLWVTLTLVNAPVVGRVAGSGQAGLLTGGDGTALAPV